MDAKKGLIWGGVILVLGVGGFLGWRMWKKKKAMKQLGENYPQSSSSSGGYTSSDDGGSSGSSSSGDSGFDANAEANALKATMQGWGTDDDGFWRITNRLSSSEKKKVKNVFPDLKTWIEGDFSFGDETKALAAWGF